MSRKSSWTNFRAVDIAVGFYTNIAIHVSGKPLILRFKGQWSALLEISIEHTDGTQNGSLRQLKERSLVLGWVKIKKSFLAPGYNNYRWFARPSTHLTLAAVNHLSPTANVGVRLAMAEKPLKSFDIKMKPR